MSVVGEARALGCGGVEDLHLDLLHTLLHGASRERGGLSAAHRAQGAEDTGSDGCAGTGLEAARPEVGCRGSRPHSHAREQSGGRAAA